MFKVAMNYAGSNDKRACFHSMLKFYYHKYTYNSSAIKVDIDIPTSMLIQEVLQWLQTGC